MPSHRSDVVALTVARGRVPRGLLRALALGASTLGLASCVVSDKALVSDAKPIMGSQFTAQLYRRFTDGRAHELRASTFRWKDGAYVVVDGAVDLRRFVSMRLKGDDEIIQGSDAGGKAFTYWLGRKLVDGAYLILPLDEGHADAAIRSTLCTREEPGGFCVVDTKEHLVALAEATAKGASKDAEVAVIVADGVKPVSDILDVRR